MKTHRTARPAAPGGTVVSCGGLPFADYPTLDAALKALCLASLSLSDCGGFVALSGSGWFRPLLLTFHDASGSWIPPEAAVARAREMERERQARIAARRRGGYDEAVYRSGPVPGTGAKRGYGNWLRAMRTMQERRAAAAAGTGDPPVRARRNQTNLPDSWDDVRRGRRGRTWKVHRRTRWKEKASDH